MLSSKALLIWYDQQARQLPWRISPKDRKQGVLPDPYRVWLSEIMLQQTTIATVKDYYRRFLAKWPTISDLAVAPLDDVLKMWAGLGYYARARNLYTCAQLIASDWGGIFPNTANDLQTLPGVGPYTSAAIAAICHDQKIAVVDGNVERVSARLLALDRPVREAKPQINQLIQNSVPERAGDYAQALMDLGATICTPTKPDCPRCPLRQNCSGRKTKNPTQFPIKPAKKERPSRFGHAFIIQQPNGYIFLQTRPEKGLLAKMTQVPNSDWKSQMVKVTPPLDGEWQNVGNVTHVFTHFQLQLEVWLLPGAPKNLPLDGFWVEPSELKDQALPTLFHKVLALRP